MLDRINGIVINCHVLILIFKYSIKVTENITQRRRDGIIPLYCNNHHAPTKISEILGQKIVRTRIGRTINSNKLCDTLLH